MGFLGIAGAVASIVGAFQSWRSAGQAKTAAAAAEEARDDVQTRAVLSDLSALAALEDRAMRALAKYGQGASDARLAGGDVSRDAEAVQEYLTALRRSKLEFGISKDNPADRLCDEAHPVLQQLVDADNTEARVAKGRELYMLLDGFSHRLKAKLDSHRMGRIVARGARRLPT